MKWQKRYANINEQNDADIKNRKFGLRTHSDEVLWMFGLFVTVSATLAPELNKTLYSLIPSFINVLSNRRWNKRNGQAKRVRLLVVITEMKWLLPSDIPGVPKT